MYCAYRGHLFRLVLRETITRGIMGTDEYDFIRSVFYSNLARGVPSTGKTRKNFHLSFASWLNKIPF